MKYEKGKAGAQFQPPRAEYQKRDSELDHKHDDNARMVEPSRELVGIPSERRWERLSEIMIIKRGK